jgi:hypothetical protein
MILVRNRNGTLYFLAREGEDALDSLRNAYPGRPLAVLKKADGLAILRVGNPGPAVGGEEGEEGERLSIVNLVLPPAPAAISSPS